MSGSGGEILACSAGGSAAVAVAVRQAAIHAESMLHRAVSVRVVHGLARCQPIQRPEAFGRDGCKCLKRHFLAVDWFGANS